MKLLISLIFIEISDIETSTKRFIVLLVFLLNIAVISSDKWLGEILKISIKFQVINSYKAKFLINRDAIKRYKIDI
jgi:hypothetical protein